MIGFGNLYETIYVPDDSVLYNVTQQGNSCYLFFDTKTVVIEGSNVPSQFSIIETYVKGNSDEILFLGDCNIYQELRRNQVIHQLEALYKHFPEITSLSLTVSFGAEMVLTGIIDTCKDIDVFISKHLSLILENKYMIRRSPAPAGNTSQQSYFDIDMFVETDGMEKDTKPYRCFPFLIETRDSLINTYEKRGRKEDLEKIKLIRKGWF